MIDWTQMVAPEDRAAEEHMARRSAAASECHRRILEVASEYTQMNMVSAAAAGLLSAAEQSTYRKALQWVGAMRAAWKAIADAKRDPGDDKEWPPLPDDVRDLVKRF